MKKISLFFIFIGIVTLLYGCGEKETKTTPKKVVVNNNSINIFGVVKSKDTNNITMDITAKVDKICVLDGQILSKGDDIMKFDMTDFNTTITKSESELIVTKKSLSTILESNTIGNSELSNLNKTLETKKSNLNSGNDQIQKDYEKNYQDAEIQYQTASKKLGEDTKKYLAQTISKEEYEKSEKDSETDKMKRDKAKSELENYLNSKKTEIVTTESKIQEKTITLQKSQPEVALKICSDNEKIKLLETTILNLKNKVKGLGIEENTLKCQMDKALIKDIGFSQGDITQPKKLFTLYNLDKLVIEAYVPEEMLKNIKKGNKAKIVPVADKNKEYKGIITYISNSTMQRNNETVIAVEIEFEKDDFMMPLLNVEVKVETT